MRPLHSGPTNSVIAPMGKPPSSRPSTAATPVGVTGRMIRGKGVRAEGMRRARIASIWCRIAEAGVYSFYSRLAPILLAIIWRTISGAYRS